MDSVVPVVVLAATDSLTRDLALLTALIDAPDVTAIVHDFDESEDGEFSLRRRVFTGSRPVEESLLTLAHPCAGCAMREDAVPAIAEAIARGARAIVLGLPLGAEILPATRTLLSHAGPGGQLSGIRLGSTVTVCASTTTQEQLGDGDDALVAQLVGADIVLVDGGRTEAVGSDLVDCFRWSHSARYDDLCEPWLSAAITGDHDDEELERRCDPVTVAAGHGPQQGHRGADGALVAGSGVWLLELSSPRPVHPRRLLALGEQLAPETVTSRGRFTVPNRPGWVCGWDAIGGEVAVGLAGPGDAGTRIVFVGTGDRTEIHEAFHHALATDVELSLSAAQWKRVRDPLARYLDGPDAADVA